MRGRKKINKSNKQYQDSDEEIQEERWLSKQITKLKTRNTHSNTLMTNNYFSKLNPSIRNKQSIRVPEENYDDQLEESEYDDSGIQSKVWQFFVVNIKENMIKCVQCHKQYQRTGTNISKMMLHLKSQHPKSLPKLPSDPYEQSIVFKPQIQGDTHSNKNQSMLLKKQKIDQLKKGHHHFIPSPHNNNSVQVSPNQQKYEEIINNLGLECEQFELKLLLRSERNYSPSQASKMLMQHHWRFVESHQQIYRKLSSNINISILKHQFIDNAISYSVILTKTMKQNFHKYKDSMSFWFYEHPIQGMNPKGVIYVIGQNKNIEPVLMGIMIIYKFEFEPIKKMICEYFSSIKFTPRSMVICGPALISQACETVIKIQLLPTQGGNKLKRIYNLGPSLNTILKQNFSLYSESIKQILFGQKIDHFPHGLMGFTISKVFIEKILHLIRLELNPQGKYASLTSFLTQIFKNQKIMSIHSSGLQFIEDDHSILYALQNCQPQLNNCPILMGLRGILYKNVFIKFACLYYYARLYLQVKSNQQGIFQVYEKKKQESINYQWFEQPKPKLVQYDIEKSMLVCTCQLSSLIGLPCPHLIKISWEHNILERYINPRWFYSQTDHPKIIQRNNLLVSKDNDEYRIHENCTSQISLIRSLFQ